MMTNSIKFSVFCLAVAALLSGCVTHYSEPGFNQPSATVILEKGYPVGSGFGFGRSTIHSYHIYPTGDCSQPAQAANFHYATGPRKELRVPVDRPLTFLSDISDNRFGMGLGGAVTRNTDSCRLIGEFRPLPGRTYQVSMPGNGYSCQIVVTDLTTGWRVPDLRVYRADFDGPSCR